MFARKGQTPQIPSRECDLWQYVSFLTEAGPTEWDAMGNEKPLTWETIFFYWQCTGELDEVWERKLVQNLSEEYLIGKNEGKNPLSISPMERDED